MSQGAERRRVGATHREASDAGGFTNPTRSRATLVRIGRPAIRRETLTTAKIGATHAAMRRLTATYAGRRGRGILGRGGEEVCESR
jgi:hypothetical protein